MAADGDPFDRDPLVGGRSALKVALVGSRSTFQEMTILSSSETLSSIVKRRSGKAVVYRLTSRLYPSGPLPKSGALGA